MKVSLQILIRSRNWILLCTMSLALSLWRRFPNWWRRSLPQLTRLGRRSSLSSNTRGLWYISRDKQVNISPSLTTLSHGQHDCSSSRTWSVTTRETATRMLWVQYYARDCPDGDDRSYICRILAANMLYLWSEISLSKNQEIKKILFWVQMCVTGQGGDLGRVEVGGLSGGVWPNINKQTWTLHCTGN